MIAPTIDEALTLVGVIADAAAQAHLLSLRRQDRRLVEQGWLVRHAVDSNIVALWVRPTDQAEQGPERRLGFGEVFRADPSGRKAAFAAVLANYIWMKLEAERPLLLVPPIDREVGAFMQLHTSWPVPKPADMSRVHELVRRIRLKNYPLSAEEHGLLLKAAVLDSAVKEHSRRMERLYTEGRVASLDLLGPGSGEDPDVQEVVRAWTRLEDMVRYSEAKSGWITRFKAIKRPETERSERDAEALARIELWNKELARRRLPKKLLYITGDSAIICASTLHTSTWFEGTFLQNFIRHPRSYLDDTGLFDSEAEAFGSPPLSIVDNEPLTMAKWLTLLIGGLVQDEKDEIGTWTDSRFELKRGVRQVIEHVEEQRPKEASEILGRWSDFSSKVVQQAASTQGFLGRLETAEGPAEIGLALAEIGPVVQDEIDEAQRRWVAAVTDARVLMEVLSHAGKASRNVARLCFERQSTVQDLIFSARRWYEERRLDFAAYEQFRAALHESDPSDYYVHLAVASMLAGGRQWESARILSSFARSLKKNVRDYVAGYPNGREASFFEAVCIRHSAKTPEQLGQAEDLIADAERIAAAEAKSRPGLDIVPERFRAEELALRQTQALYRWKDSEPAELCTCFMTLLNDIAAMKLALESRIATVRAEPPDKDERQSTFVPRNERLDLLEDLVMRQLINTVSISLMLETPELIKLGTAAARDIESRLAKKSANLSFFGQLVRHAGSYTYLRTQSAKDQFNQLATRDALNLHAVFPFDKRRFAHIRARLDVAGKARGVR